MNKKIASLFLLLSIINTSVLFAQKEPTTKPKFTAHNKGKIFLAWGGNRDYFSDSDIRFQGSGYDFTLSDVASHDKPKGWHIDYVNPARMTIPQTNFRLGYFLNDHYSIAFAIDHMKYVMTQNQTVIMNGSINNGLGFDGVYNNVAKKMTEDFLTFEHTDGLNYIHTEFSRHDDISPIFRLPNTDKFQINITEGIGGGVLFPKTNAMLMSQQRHDEFHVAGYGLSAKAGLNLTFYKYFYLQGELKTGYINMPNIQTTHNNTDKASQDFGFFETLIQIGFIYNFFSK
ncbi:MAG: hypothetical protein ACI7YS_02120 [Flavobacterium sp.]